MEQKESRAPLIPLPVVEGENGLGRASKGLGTVILCVTTLQGTQRHTTQEYWSSTTYKGFSFDIFLCRSTQRNTDQPRGKFQF